MDIQDRINSEAATRLAVVEASDRPVLELMVDASVISQMLFKMKSLPCTEKVRCLEKEGKRLTGWPKLSEDAGFRAWTNFDPHNLCSNCCAYYHAEMAASELRYLAMCEADQIEDEKRKG